MIEIIFGVFASVFAVLFLAVGIIALIGGFQQKRRCSASAAGTVTRIHTEIRDKGKHKMTVYTPEFSFEAEGHTYRMKSHFGSMKRDFKEEQKVTIRYDPADPKVAFVADDANNSSQGSIMCLILGLLCAIGAVALFT